MPQLNPLDWGPQLLWLLITFGILYLLMVYVALPRIGSVIEARAARIAGDLARADKLRRETEEAIAAYEQALAEARQKAHAIVEEGRAKLKAETAEERARLESELAARSAEAEARIATARNAGNERRECYRSRCRGRYRAPAHRGRSRQGRDREGGRNRAEGLTMEFLLEPEFWVAVSFFLFVGVVIYLGVHKKIAVALDARAASIAKELDEARRLRQEAEKVLADYRRKQGEAAKEAEAIVSLAAKEAEILTAETRRSMQEHFERRMKLAEDKIARAEAEALREVRAAAADAAIAAAQAVIAEKLTPEAADKLVKQGIDALKGKLN